VRASRLRTVRAYACAGAACGLAAAAKYNGGIVIVAIAVTWLLYERTAPDRGRKAAAIAGGAAIAFLLGAPYTLLAMPEFLNGFAAQFARFTVPRAAVEPNWLIYLKHLSPPWARWSVPLGVIGLAAALWRRETRRAWTPTLVFAAVYFYALSTHSPVFGRYALPLVPVMCLAIAAAAVQGVRVLQRYAPLRRPAASAALWAAVTALLLSTSAIQTVKWLDALKRADTRTMAAEWMKSSLPRGARVAVENSGPTYLSAAGFRVVGTEQLIDRPLDWFRQRADYLVISAADPSRYGAYLSAGSTVYQIVPSAQRWGPAIVIVKIQ